MLYEVITNAGAGVDVQEFYAHQLGPAAQGLGIHRLGEDGVVGGAGTDPGLGPHFQIRHRLPQGAGHRQLGQGLGQIHHLQIVDHQAEAVAQVDQAGVDP